MHCHVSGAYGETTYVAMKVGRSEGIFLDTPAFREEDKVGNCDTWSVALARQDGEDAWIRVIVEDGSDGCE